MPRLSVDALTPIDYELQVFSLALVRILVMVRVLSDLVHRHAVRPARVREEKVHDSATWDALAVRCSQSNSAMSAQAWLNSTHFTMHFNRACNNR